MLRKRLIVMVITDFFLLYICLKKVWTKCLRIEMLGCQDKDVQLFSPRIIDRLLAFPVQFSSFCPLILFLSSSSAFLPAFLYALRDKLQMTFFPHPYHLLCFLRC